MSAYDDAIAELQAYAIITVAKEGPKACREYLRRLEALEEAQKDPRKPAGGFSEVLSHYRRTGRV